MNDLLKKTVEHTVKAMPKEQVITRQFKEYLRDVLAIEKEKKTETGARNSKKK